MEKTEPFCIKVVSIKDCIKLAQFKNISFHLFFCDHMISSHELGKFGKFYEMF